MPAESLEYRPRALAVSLQTVLNAPLPLRGASLVPCSGGVLTAVLNYWRKVARPVSCYAFFKGWLLLSQPPGCLSDFTSFPT